jgi:hypothetical protein
VRGALAFLGAVLLGAVVGVGVARVVGTAGCETATVEQRCGWGR